MKFDEKSLSKAQDKAMQALPDAMKYNEEEKRSVLHLNEILEAYRNVLEPDEQEVLRHQIAAMDSAVFIAWFADPESETHKELLAAKQRMIDMLEELKEKDN